jgi:midasin
VIYAFIQASPFRTSPLALISSNDILSAPPDRLQALLLAYNRLLTADPRIAERNSWPITPLHTLRTTHPSKAVRLLAVSVLSKQRRWSETKRKAMELEWVGDMDQVNVEVFYGYEVVQVAQGGFEVNVQLVDGWVLAILEHQRYQSCECAIA